MRWIQRYRSILFLFVLSWSGQLWAQHKLQLQLKDFGIHVGQAFFVRVVDLGSNSEVGREKLDAIPSANFNVDLWVLIQGHSYRVDFFADYNQNGKYDSPPADHAYSIEVDNVDGDQTVSFSHTGSFVNIDWPAWPGFTDFAGTWTGYWENRTYQTTAEINAVIEVIPDSMKVRITSTTSGVFGNPETITQKTEMTYDPEAESMEIAAPSPWTGGVTITQGEFHGAVTAPDYGGITLNLDGNFGSDQYISEYIMSGAFTANGIIVMTKESDSGVEPLQTATVPDEFQLGQNYPNPFNHETVIPFSVQDNANVELTVHDILGRQIDVLVNKFMPAGSYEVRFNPSNLTSGLYFYELRSNNSTIVRKMILSN